MIDAKTKSFLFSVAIILLIWILTPSVHSIAKNAALGWKEGSLEFSAKVAGQTDELNLMYERLHRSD